MLDAAGMPASDGALEQSGPREPSVSKCGVRSKTECIMRAWLGAEASGQSSTEFNPSMAAYPTSVVALANRCNLGVRLHASHALFCVRHSAVLWRRSTSCTYVFRVLENPG